ncbi:MAG: OmpA family protein [Bdellovibrionota bacterium]
MLEKVQNLISKLRWTTGLILVVATAMLACQQRGNGYRGYNGYYQQGNQRGNYNYSTNNNQAQMNPGSSYGGYPADMIEQFRQRYNTGNDQDDQTTDDDQKSGYDPYKDAREYEIVDQSDDWKKDVVIIKKAISGGDQALIKGTMAARIGGILADETDSDGDRIPDEIETLLSASGSIQFGNDPIPAANFWGSDGLGAIQGMEPRPGLTKNEFNGWTIAHRMFKAEDLQIQEKVKVLFGKDKAKKGIHPVRSGDTRAEQLSTALDTKEDDTLDVMTWSNPDDFFYQAHFGTATKKKDQQTFVLRTSDEGAMWKADQQDVGGVRGDSGPSFGLLSSVTGGYGVNIAKRISFEKLRGYSDYTAAKRVAFFSRYLYLEGMDSSTGLGKTNAAAAYLFDTAKLKNDYALKDKAAEGDGKRYPILASRWNKLNQYFQQEYPSNKVLSTVEIEGKNPDNIMYKGIMMPRSGKYQAIGEGLDFSLIPGGDTVKFPFDIATISGRTKVPSSQVSLAGVDVNIDTLRDYDEFLTVAEAYLYAPEEMTLVMGALTVPESDGTSVVVREGSDANFSALVVGETTKLVHSALLADKKGDTSSLKITSETVVASDTQCPWVRVLFIYASSSKQFERMQSKQGGVVLNNEIYKLRSDGTVTRIGQSEVRMLPPQCDYTTNKGVVPLMYDNTSSMKNQGYDEGVYVDNTQRGSLQSQATWMSAAARAQQQAEAQAAKTLQTNQTAASEAATGLGVSDVAYNSNGTMTSASVASIASSVATLLKNENLSQQDASDISSNLGKLISSSVVDDTDKTMLQGLKTAADEKVGELAKTPFEKMLDEESTVTSKGSYAVVNIGSGEYLSMPNSTQLTAVDKTELDKVAALISKWQGQPGIVFHIKGHANGVDSPGNKNASLTRAQTVATYLQSKGIDANQIKVYGMSSIQALAGKTIHDGANRRVEILAFANGDVPVAATTQKVTASRSGSGSAKPAVPAKPKVVIPN